MARQAAEQAVSLGLGQSIKFEAQVGSRQCFSSAAQDIKDPAADQPSVQFAVDCSYICLVWQWLEPLPGACHFAARSISLAIGETKKEILVAILEEPWERL